MHKRPAVEALAWWEARTSAGRQTGLRNDLPSAAAVRALLRRRLITFAPGGWAFCLHHENADSAEIIRSQYWPLVACALHRYAPAAVDRLSALRLHLGDQSLYPELRACHASSRSEWRLALSPMFKVQLSPPSRHATGKSAANVPTTLISVDSGVEIPVVSAAALLLTLTLGDLEAAGPSMIAVWLRSLRVKREDIHTAVDVLDRPLLLQRMEYLALDAGNTTLAELLREVADETRDRRISRAQAGVSGHLVLREPAAPAYNSNANRWDAEVLFTAAERFDEAFPFDSITRWEHSPDSELSEFALAMADDDVVQHLRLEGFEVSVTDLHTLARRQAGGHAGDHTGNTTLALAVQRYRSAARCLRELTAGVYPRALVYDRTNSFGRRRDVFVNIVRSVHAKLYPPRAGVIQNEPAKMLLPLRSHSIQIPGSTYRPPSSQIDVGLRSLKTALQHSCSSPRARAAFIHWAMLYLCPFVEGNGSVARLMMNHELALGDHAWTIIQADDRSRYVAALDDARQFGNFEPYIAFMRETFDHAEQQFAGFRRIRTGEGSQE